MKAIKDNDCGLKIHDLINASYSLCNVPKICRIHKLLSILISLLLKLSLVVYCPFSIYM